MIVDNLGALFENRRKTERRKDNKEVSKDKRKTERRKADSQQPSRKK